MEVAHSQTVKCIVVESLNVTVSVTSRDLFTFQRVLSEVPIPIQQVFDLFCSMSTTSRPIRHHGTLSLPSNCKVYLAWLHGLVYVVPQTLSILPSSTACLSCMSTRCFEQLELDIFLVPHLTCSYFSVTYQLFAFNITYNLDRVVLRGFDQSTLQIILHRMFIRNFKEFTLNLITVFS